MHDENDGRIKSKGKRLNMITFEKKLDNVFFSCVYSVNFNELCFFSFFDVSIWPECYCSL